MLVPLALHAMLLYRPRVRARRPSTSASPTRSRDPAGSRCSSTGSASLVYRPRRPAGAVLPLAAVAVLLPALMPGAHVRDLRAATPRSSCTSPSRCSPTASSRSASLHALLMARSRRSGCIDGVLPPFLQEPAAAARRWRRCSSASCWPRFILLTLTLASGVVFSEELFGKPLTLHPQDRVRRRLVAHLRRRCSPGATSTAGAGAPRCAGRSRASSTLLLAYIGSKFVLEVMLGALGRHHGRHSTHDWLFVGARRAAARLRVLLDRRDQHDGAQPLPADAPRAAGPPRRAPRADLLASTDQLSAWSCSATT